MVAITEPEGKSPGQKARSWEFAKTSTDSYVDFGLLIAEPFRTLLAKTGKNGVKNVVLVCRSQYFVEQHVVFPMM